MHSYGHVLQKILSMALSSKLTVCSLLDSSLTDSSKKTEPDIARSSIFKELNQASPVVGRRFSGRMLSASQCTLGKPQGSVSLGCSAPWQAALNSSTNAWEKKGNEHL